MLRRVSLSILVLALGLLVAVPAFAAPGQPNFGPAVFADGQAWGTKFTTALPPATEDTIQSFDKLYVITNGATGQLGVADAGPTNPTYNGGRWYVHTATWTPEAIAALGGTPPVLTSGTEVLMYAGMGYLTITPGAPPGRPDFFQCPLLPVK